jgi:hypothetical protein
VVIHTVDSEIVQRAGAEMVDVLGPHDSLDWQVPAGSLTWSCWTTAAHVAHDLLAYAAQLAARPTTAYLPFDLVITADASPREVLQVVTACAELLSNAVAAANPETRAWHWGLSDPAGFAAMGIGETVLHTFDITQGLGLSWLPPQPLCAAVLSRLFPDAPAGDPVQILLWCTGRANLDGYPRVTSWGWKAAVS